jgi:hypothetical protein
MHLEHVLRHLTDALRDAPAVHRLQGEGFENQQVQRALDQISRFAHLFSSQ